MKPPMKPSRGGAAALALFALLAPGPFLGLPQGPDSDVSITTLCKAGSYARRAPSGSGPDRPKQHLQSLGPSGGDGIRSIGQGDRDLVVHRLRIHMLDIHLDRFLESSCDRAVSAETFGSAGARISANAATSAITLPAMIARNMRSISFNEERAIAFPR